MFQNGPTDSSSSRRAVIRPRLIRPNLEALEDRVLPANYLWTGADNGNNYNWSNRINWLVNKAVPAQAPGAGDDLTFDGTGAGGAVHKSIVDAAFSGVVKSITVLGTFTETLTLNRDLRLQLGTSTIAGSKILGAGNLEVGDNPAVGPPASATLNWTGGTLGGSGVVRVGLSSTVEIKGAGVKSLDGRNFYNMAGYVTWDGAGDISLTNKAMFLPAYGGGTTFTVASTAGRIMAITGTENETVEINAGIMDIDIDAASILAVSARFNNFAQVNVRQGRLFTGLTQNSGTMTVFGGAELWLGGDEKDVILDTTESSVAKVNMGGRG